MAPIHDFEKEESLNNSIRMKIFEMDTKRHFENIPDNIMVFCYSCNTLAKGKDLANHLFLGRLDCKYCTTILPSCEKFRLFFYSNTLLCSQSNSGQHEFLKWQSTGFDYLAYFLRKELMIDRFCQNKKGSPSAADVQCAVKDFIINLKVLETHLPWKVSLKKCWKYLESQNIRKQNVPDGNFERTEREICNTPTVKSYKTIRKEGIYNSRCLDVKNKPTSLQKETRATTENSEHKVVCDNIEMFKPINISENFKTLDEHQRVNDKTQVSVTCVSNFFTSKNTVKTLSTSSPLETPKDIENNREETQSSTIQRHSEPCEELLSSFNLEGLDQSVEYVTVEVDCEDNNRITEELGTLLPGTDKGDCGNESKKRKSDINFYKHKRLKNHDLSSPEKFKPPYDIPDKRYLVLHFPTEGCPEECPNCYCEFCPSMLTVNCSTFISTIICSDCKLTIYVLPE